MHVLAIMLIFYQELARSTDIKLKNIFVFCPLDFVLSFYTSNEMTIKPTEEQRGYYFLHIHSLHGLTSSTKKCQVIKKKLNLKNQEIILAEAFLVHNPKTQILFLEKSTIKLSKKLSQCSYGAWKAECC